MKIPNSFRKCAAVLISAIMFSCSSETRPKADTTEAALHGKVKTVEEKTIKSGEPENWNAAGPSIKLAFNEDGYLTDDILYNDDRTIYRKVSYHYDEHGFKSASEEYLGNELAFRCVYTCDAIGNPIEEKHFLPDRRLSYTISRKFDNRNNKQEETVQVYNPAAWCRGAGKDVFQYDRDGFRIKQFHYDTLNTLGSIYHTIRDKNGNITENDNSSYKYVFDAQGNWIRQTAFSKSSQDSTVTIRRIEYY